MKVDFEELFDKMEEVLMGQKAYFNKKTGEVHLFTQTLLDSFIDYSAEPDEEIDESLPDWEKEAKKEFLEVFYPVGEPRDDYIPMPTQRDVHEWAIMEKFCFTIEEKEIREEMDGRIHGSGAFRRFKSGIHKYNIEEDWYKFREKELREILKFWCERNDIEYEEGTE